MRLLVILKGLGTCEERAGLAGLGLSYLKPLASGGRKCAAAARKAVLPFEWQSASMICIRIWCCPYLLSWRPENCQTTKAIVVFLVQLFLCELRPWSQNEDSEDFPIEGKCLARVAMRCASNDSTNVAQLNGTVRDEWCEIQWKHSGLPWLTVVPWLRRSSI